MVAPACDGGDGVVWCADVLSVCAFELYSLLFMQTQTLATSHNNPNNPNKPNHSTSNPNDPFPPTLSDLSEHFVWVSGLGKVPTLFTITRSHHQKPSWPEASPSQSPSQSPPSPEAITITRSHHHPPKTFTATVCVSVSPSLS